MKKFLILGLAIVLVLSLTAVSMAAVTIGGNARFQWFDLSNTDPDSFKKDSIRINLDNNVNDFASYHTQLRVNVDNNPFLWDYYAVLKPSLGTIQVGQWENDFYGDVDVFGQFATDEFTDTLWYTPWAVQFAPKLGGGFTAAVWYNPADAATVKRNNNVVNYSAGNSVSVGKGAYTASVGYANDALAVQAAVGDVGEISGKNYDTLTLFNASYKVNAFKFFLHYGQAGKDNPWSQGTEKKNEIIGVNYKLSDTGFSTQLEYDSAPDKDNPVGLGLYYSADSVGYTYYYVTQGDDTYQELRLLINF